MRITDRPAAAEALQARALAAHQAEGRSRLLASAALAEHGASLALEVRTVTTEAVSYSHSRRLAGLAGLLGRQWTGGHACSIWSTLERSRGC